MSRFLTALNVELIDDRSNDGRGRWILTLPLVYESDLLKSEIIVPIGFETDYASVPRVPLAFWLTGDTAHSAAVLHDYLYSTQKYSRSIADGILYEAAGISGVPDWRARVMWAGVRAFGWFAWSKK